MCVNYISTALNDFDFKLTLNSSISLPVKLGLLLANTTSMNRHSEQMCSSCDINQPFVFHELDGQLYVYNMASRAIFAGKFLHTHECFWCECVPSTCQVLTYTERFGHTYTCIRVCMYVYWYVFAYG